MWLWLRTGHHTCVSPGTTWSPPPQPDKASSLPLPLLHCNGLSEGHTASSCNFLLPRGARVPPSTAQI